MQTSDKLRIAHYFVANWIFVRYRARDFSGRRVRDAIWQFSRARFSRLIKLTASPTKAPSAIEALLNPLDRFADSKPRELHSLSRRDPRRSVTSDSSRTPDSTLPMPAQIGKQLRGFPPEINIVIDCGISVDVATYISYENSPRILNLRKAPGKPVKFSCKLCKVVLIIF